jgi:hypothetical protein
MVRGEISLPSAVIFLAYLAGCSQQQLAAVASPPPMTGPEVFIPNTPAKFVRYRIITKLLSIGATLDQDSQVDLVFALSSSNLAYRFLLGHQDHDVFGRIHLTLAEDNGGTRVFGAVEFVQNYKSDHEVVRPASQAELPKMQGVLHLLRESFASAPMD